MEWIILAAVAFIAFLAYAPDGATKMLLAAGWALLALSVVVSLVVGVARALLR